MGSTSRGFRNLYRNKFRGALIVVVLGISVGFFAVMIQTSTVVGEQTSQLRSELETLIQVRPAGTGGMGIAPGIPPLSDAVYQAAKDIPNIASIERQLPVQTQDDKLAPIISVHVGVEAGKPLRLGTLGDLGTPEIIDGRGFLQSDEGSNVAVIGKVFSKSRASLYGLDEIRVGDRINLDGTKFQTAQGFQTLQIDNADIKNTELEVVGVFSMGTSAFADNQIFLPLKTTQRIYGYEEDEFRILFINVDSVDNVQKVADAIKDRSGAKVDIITGQERIQIASQALASLSSNTTMGAVLSASGSAAVIIFTMVLVTRERTKEIGVLKAIGASNTDVAKQFVVEAIALALIGSALGVSIFAFSGSTLSSIVIGGSGDIFNVTYTASPLLIGQIFGMTIILGIIGSIYPVIRAVRTDPALSLRYE